jgi:phage FluMu gp28-like protein
MTLLLFMAAILTSTIDKPAALSRYFLPYQLEWIEDGSRLKQWEKSFRIGATWADGFANVRKRLMHAKRDYLFATKDWPSALEYMSACKQFCDVFGVAKSIVSHGEELVTVPIFDQDKKDTGFTQEIKMGVIKFDNASRIIAFTSNPNAMLVYGGDVGLDEFPRHQRAQELYDIAQARVTWGYDLAMWGSHKGNDTLFYQIALDARKGKGGWSHHFTTIEDAVAQGLVEKINQTRGTSFTREEFIADCKQRARDEATYQEAYMCNPKGGTACIVNWSQIEQCMMKYQAERLHLEALQIEQLFGRFNPATRDVREMRIKQFLDAAFPKLFDTPGHHNLGYDVAASGQGDLAALYVDRKQDQTAQAHGLLTWRTDDWDFHDVVTHHFMDRLTAVRGAGDKTGLGMKICWELEQDYPDRFEGVNFASEKHEMGFALMNQLSTAEKRWPGEWQDVATDYFALRKTHTGKKWIFSEGTNNLMEYSHCDVAWAGALATRAGSIARYLGSAADIQAWGKPRGQSSNRGLEG